MYWSPRGSKKGSKPQSLRGRERGATHRCPAPRCSHAGVCRLLTVGCGEQSIWPPRFHPPWPRQRYSQDVGDDAHGPHIHFGAVRAPVEDFGGWKQSLGLTHGCGERPAAQPRWEPHGRGNTSWAPAASPEPGAAAGHPCTELCTASGREQPPRVSLPPQLCPPAHRSTPASRRRFSWCPAHPRSWRARSHLGGTQRGVVLPSGGGTIQPPHAADPPGGPPGKPTDFKGSIGGQVCVEQVLRLQVTVDDSVFMQILQRERQWGCGREGKGQGGPVCLGQNSGGGGSDPGPGTNTGPTRPTVPLETPTPAVPELLAWPRGHGKDVFRYEFPLLNPPVAIETPSPADL